MMLRSSSGVGAAEHEVDRVVVDLLDFGDAGHVDAHRALRLLDAAEGEDHVVGSEGAAVGELDALAQFEAHLRRADHGPLGGQRRLDLVLGVVAGQAFVGMHQDRVRGGMVLRMRVQRQDVVLRGPAQHFGLRRAGHRRAGKHRGRQQGTEFHASSRGFESRNARVNGLPARAGKARAAGPPPGGTRPGSAGRRPPVCQETEGRARSNGVRRASAGPVLQCRAGWERSGFFPVRAVLQQGRPVSQSADRCSRKTRKVFQPIKAGGNRSER